MSIDLHLGIEYGTLWFLIGSGLVIFITLLVVGRKS